jgi:hypothetical protein
VGGPGGAGGSGVVVLRVPNTAAAVFSGGVATRSYDVVGYTTYEVQATTTTGETVTFYPNAFLAEYLVVAGGGGGGGMATGAQGGGGGGAGGYLASASAVAMAVVTGQAYPVIVGGGGAGGVGQRRLWRSHHQNPRHQDRNIYWWRDRDELNIWRV